MLEITRIGATFLFIILALNLPFKDYSSCEILFFLNMVILQIGFWNKKNTYGYYAILDLIGYILIYIFLSDYSIIESSAFIIALIVTILRLYQGKSDATQ